MEVKFCFIVFLISTIFTKFYATGDILLESKMRSHLPVILQPEKYVLDISTEVTKDVPNFHGAVRITIKCWGRTKKIIMRKNMLDIQIIEVWLLTNEGKEEKQERPVQIKDKDMFMSEDRFKLVLNEHLEKDNRYLIEIKYSDSAHSVDYNTGYIFRPYEKRNVNSDIQYIAYTQLNYVEAGRVLPCFDQIGMKATFLIQHRHPGTVKSFSNTGKLIDAKPIEDDPLLKGWVKDTFDISEPMSTFSLALVVANYNTLEKYKVHMGHNQQVHIKLWAADHVLVKEKTVLENVLNAFSQCYGFFANYFKVPSKLEKLDLIVTPDMNVNVQDSYGLIILKQDVIIKTFDKPNTNLPDEYMILSDICLAVSRQWIGHSVTMSDWNEIWAHFGLNTVLEKLCINKVFRDRKGYSKLRHVETFFLLLAIEERGDYNPIVSLGSHSFFTPASDSVDTYTKVYHVMRMLSFILKSDEDLFRKSLENYLQEYRSKNTNLDQLWKMFTKTVNEEDINPLPKGITVEMIIDSWLGQTGHPHIIVSIDKTTNEVVVKQKYLNFSKIGQENVDPVEKKGWIIPLTYTTKEKMEFKKVKVQEWLYPGKEVRINSVNVEEWILFNLQIHVPCRVSYEYSIWSSIQKSLLNKEEYLQFDHKTRMHLISDMFALAEAEELSYKFVFTSLDFLAYENNYSCWKVIVYELNRIRFRWKRTELYSFYQFFVVEKLRSVLREKVLTGTTIRFDQIWGNEKKKYPYDAFENLVMVAACIFETNQCLQFTHTLRKEWKEKEKFDKYTNMIPRSMHDSIFALAVKHAEKDEWDFLFHKYDKTVPPSSSLNNLLLNTLCNSEKLNILQKYFDWGMDLNDGSISPILRLKVFEGLAFNPEGYPIIMDFLKSRDDFSKLKRLLNVKTGITIENFIIKAIEATRKRDDFDELVGMWPKYHKKDTPISKLMEETKIKADRNISWLERKEKSTIEYFTGKPEPE